VKLKLQLNVTQLFYLAKQEDRKEAEEIKKQKASIIIHSMRVKSRAQFAASARVAGV
jgi:hypothetical protein